MTTRKKTIYLINPKNDYASYFGGEVFEGRLGKPGLLVADLAVTTVAALMRPYLNVMVCEQNVEPVDFDVDCDFVGITGKLTQWQHAKEIADRFHKRGIPVLIGGPFASLSPSTVGPYADILVTGELEMIVEDLCADLNEGRWKATYDGIQADMSQTVIPAWDLYPNHRSMVGNLQVSRGCPFQCEFCDVIQYLGRKQRHKPIGKILEELDYIHKIGYTNSFISDDNFTVYRSRAKEILEALAHWNHKDPDRSHRFVTQVSMDVTRDPEMLELLNKAGFTSIFIGIETPNEESLKETRKLQNTKIDLVEELNKIYAQGVSVFAGMIVGFDNDGHDIFERQFEFAMQSAIPFFSLNFLGAMESTPLYARLKKSGRLKFSHETPMETQFTTNVKFQQLSDEESMAGMQWLLTQLYAPENFGARLIDLIDRLGPSAVSQESPLSPRGAQITFDLFRIFRHLNKMGEKEATMYNRVMRKTMEKPQVASIAFHFLYFYVQVRYLLDAQPDGVKMYRPELLNRSVFVA